MTSTFNMILVEMSKIRRLANGHLRFGQIIGNALSDRFKGDPYYIEDDELLECLTAARRVLEAER